MKEIKLENLYPEDLNDELNIINANSEEKHIEQIREYSITPTTFTSREFENDITDLYYKETYKYQNNEITRFGINVLAIDSDTNLNQIEVSEENNNGSENSSTQGSSASGSRKVGSKKPTHPPKYYELEISLLNKAITNLLDNNYKKTVVVDIFAQENGEIKIDKKSGYIETHSILLYKNPIMSSKTRANIETKADFLEDDYQSIANTDSHEIVVIDPSNSSYSAHLSNLTRDHVLHPNFTKISTIKKSVQIYIVPCGIKTGCEFNQYRDCIDIAVKLGFGFNQTEPSMYVNTQDIKQIKNLDVVKMITNQPKIDNNIIDPELVNRIKQTSYYKIIEAFNALEKTIKQNLDQVLMKSETEHGTIYNNHHQILQNKNANKVILDQLLTCNQECINTLIIEHNNLVELVGKINDTEFGELS